MLNGNLHDSGKAFSLKKSNYIHLWLLMSFEFISKGKFLKCSAKARQINQTI